LALKGFVVVVVVVIRSIFTIFRSNIDIMSLDMFHFNKQIVLSDFPGGHILRTEVTMADASPRTETSTDDTDDNNGVSLD
jgi:hypothetical protein